ncbi:MAG: hypothetical protein CR997_10090 [Acidobacteria bacterium]|nr:MAG: hypothetical protein CR997_10090 [Acidobacteriota bacterium]
MATRHKRKIRPGIKIAGFFLLYALLMSAVSYGVFCGYRFLHRSPYFNIKHVEFEGASKRTEPALQAVFKEVKGKNLLTLNMNDYQNRALAHHWVSDVTLFRELPDTLRVHLKEKDPVGMCRLRDGVHLYDREGTLIDNVANAPMMTEQPILCGIREDCLQDDLLFGLNFLTELKDENLVFWSKVEEVDIHDRENIVAYSSAIHAPIFLGHAPIPGNLSRFLSIVDYINQNYSELEYIELGVPQQVVIMPRGGSW